MILAPTAIAVSLMLSSNLDVAYDDGVFCDTQAQIEYLITRFDDFTSDREWIAAANDHFGDERACASRAIAYMPGDIVRVVHMGAGDFGIQPILIIGFKGDDGKYQEVTPLKQWAAIKLTGTPI
jgi:hypothetical protein